MKVPLSVFKPNKKRDEPLFISAEGFFDVVGTLDLRNKGWTTVPHICNYVTGHYLIDHNEIKDLKGSPIRIGGGFYCYKNKLESLEGCPKEVGGDFSCGHNAKEFTEEEVRKLCNVKGEVYV